ncbi:MAG: DUF5683 domain-containing protein [Bacteroidota bacterium]
MTKMICQYIVFIFTCIAISIAHAQVKPTDSIPIDSVVLIKKNTTPPADSVAIRQACLKSFTIKTKKIVNLVADYTGINLVTSTAKNLLEIPHITPTGDTIKTYKHSAKKASWLSAVVPGLGQAYNHKYWKIPIIYVGFGVIGYLGYNYYTKFDHFRKTYLFRSGADSSQIDYYPNITSTDILYQNWSANRRNFELTCIFGSLLYVLNIIDASVDAHLYKFDISDDLSMRVEPTLSRFSYTSYNNSPTAGIKITLGF